MRKRRFIRDWRRRIWLFDKLVWTVMAYGMEARGWKEKEGIEKLGVRYMRWVLGVDRKTPEYMIRKEIQREKAGRAWEFEKSLEDGKGSELARKC